MFKLFKYFGYKKKIMMAVVLRIGLKKKSFSGRFLSYFSSYPLHIKVGIIENLVDSVILLSVKIPPRQFEISLYIYKFQWLS